MTYAFTFDASACTGCKACQVACKDKNNLPVGVLWRRVYEVSGGTWRNVGARSSRPALDIGVGEPNPYVVWENTVFAYNLTIACNHCIHPKCAGVCPTDAFIQREDGIVYIDESKCIGCGYCNWACPYGVPQYNPELGRMTKCNFCMDNLEVGLPPACVAACPMRVLDFVQVESDKLKVESKTPLWDVPASEHPFPLPTYSRTQPHIAIKPHAGMLNSLAKTVSNREETQPAKAKSELPLVAFTLLGQAAAGMAVLTFFSGPLTVPILIVIGALLGLGGLAAFFHLGTPKNAWRAGFHVRKSWMSREIVMIGLFGGSWFISFFVPGMGKLPLALTGLGLVLSMAQVYRLHSMRAWDTNRTFLAFIVSALLLGGLGLEILDVATNSLPKAGYQFTFEAGLVGALLLSLTDRNPAGKTTGRFRLGLIGLVLAGAASMHLWPASVGRWPTIPIFMIAFAEEVIGRWRFYAYLHQRPL